MDSSLIVFYLFFLVGVYTSADEDKRCERPEQMSYGHFVIVNVTEFAHGTTIKYICGPGYRMESLVDTRTCSGGRWDTPLPACEEITCKQQEPKHVRIVAGTPSTFPPFKVKHSLSFQCSSSELIMTGPSTITCGDDGEWSSPFPTCSDKSKCDPPPVIEFADLMVPPNSEYQLNERVEYFRRRFYTMSSGSVMTCGKGRWIGEVKCLKPCAVTADAMDANNIQPYYGQKRSLFIPHGEFLTFRCNQGSGPRVTNMLRQQCRDGVMEFPVCQ